MRFSYSISVLKRTTKPDRSSGQVFSKCILILLGKKVLLNLNYSIKLLSIGYLFFLVIYPSIVSGQEYGKSLEYGGKLFLNYSNLNRGIDLETGTDPYIRYGLGPTARIYTNAYRKFYVGADLLFMRTGHRFEASGRGFSYRQDIYQSYLATPVVLGLRVFKPRANSWFIYGGLSPMYLLGSRIDYTTRFESGPEIRSFRYNPFESWDLGAVFGTSWSPRLRGTTYLNFDLRIQAGLRPQGEFYLLERQNRAQGLQRYFVQLGVGIDNVHERSQAARAAALDRRLSRRPELFEDIVYRCGDRYCRLDAKARHQLERLARFVENNPDVLIITISGHADPSEPGEALTRERIARSRALSAKSYLLKHIRRKDLRRKIDGSVKTESLSDSKAKYPKGDPRNCRAEIRFSFAN